MNATLDQETPPYPPTPWRLKGYAVLRLQSLPVECVRSLVPEELSLVQAVPRRTLGGLVAVHYGAGSTLEYHELIVMPAMVRCGRHVGGWVSHIYVDNQQSCKAGREIWGLPKKMAEFEWQTSGAGTHVSVKANGETITTLYASDSQAWLPMPLLAPALTKKGGSFWSFRAVGRGRISATRCDVQVPATSPFASLGFGSGRCFKVDGFNLSLPKPKLL